MPKVRKRKEKEKAIRSLVFVKRDHYVEKKTKNESLRDSISISGQGRTATITLKDFCPVKGIMGKVDRSVEE